LGCIKRWILKLNKSLEENIRDQVQEEQKGESSGDEDFDDSELTDQAKKFLAFYNWTCPNCNFNHTANKMPIYYCFCGKYSEPDYDPLVLPHSCGEYCEKKKNKDC